MKPMLSADISGNLDKLVYPVYASAKLDGIRCIIKDGKPVTRTLKPIPNRFVQSYLSLYLFQQLDGELIVGAANDKNVMQKTTSGCMSFDGEPDFTFWIFDFYTEYDQKYSTRLDMLRESFTEMSNSKPAGLQTYSRLKLLNQKLILNEQELLTFEQECLANGYEGVMLRNPDGLYKFGRSTIKEGYLLKLKRFQDSEALVIGAEELMHNANEATVDNLGHTKRSSQQSGKIPGDTLGALLVRDVTTGIEFSIGTGFTAQQRDELWQLHCAGALVGKFAKYKHFPSGVKQAPRFPVFLGFRALIDFGG